MSTTSTNQINRRCGNCAYFKPEPEAAYPFDEPNGGWCRRFPEWKGAHNTHYCGEWRKEWPDWSETITVTVADSLVNQ